MPNQLPNNALYLVTESNLARGRPNSYMVSKAIEGGATIVQLREKEWTKEQYAEEARIIAGICKEHSVFFVVNDYPDIARDVGADGLHLGQEDMPLSQARRIYSGVIGKSTHSREQALAAVVEGADYISIGPVFPTRKKPNPVGLQLVREMAPKLPIPFVAIGGMKQAQRG